MRLILDDADDTMLLGRLLAEAMQAASGTDDPGENGFISTLYLYGELGGGKTTFARGFVAALPGGDMAEVASPSFTLCNEYPTTPRVLHADLYRLSPGTLLPEEMEDSLDWRPGQLGETGTAGGRSAPWLLVEWAERLDPSVLAADRLDVLFEEYPMEAPENLDILIQPCERNRLASVTAHGKAAERLLEGLRPRLESRFATPPV